MSFDLVAYDVLKASIKESIKAVIQKQRPDHIIDPAKLKDSVVLLNDARRIPAEFLLKVIDLTDVMEASKTRQNILNGAVFFIREKIAAEGYLSPRSKLYEKLTTSLALTKENTPSNNDLLAMYRALERFLRTHVYKSGDSLKGFLDDQVFVIKDYSVTHDITSLTTRVGDLQKLADKEAEELHRLANPEPVVSSKFFGLFGGSAPAKVSTPVVVPTDKVLSDAVSSGPK